jgi:hypothetical protein
MALSNAPITRFRGEHTFPTTTQQGRGTCAASTPLITSTEASLSVNSRSPSFANRPTARSSPPDLVGDLDGALANVLDELPPFAGDRDDEAITDPLPLLSRENTGCRIPPPPPREPKLAVEIRSTDETTTPKEKTLATPDRPRRNFRSWWTHHSH